MEKHFLMVLTNPVEGQEEEYNEWYTNTHVKDVLGIPGFVAAQRFKLSGEQLMGDAPYRYLAIYEIETDNLQATMAALGKASEGDGMVISSALDMEALASWIFTPITDRVVS